MEHLLAGIFDGVEVGNWQRANAGAKKNQQTRKPKPLQRPGSKAVDQRRTRLTPAEQAERLARQQARLGATRTVEGGE